MRSVEDHLSACLAVAAPLPPLDVPLLEGLDGVLAEDVVAAADVPGFDNSSMDGYAVRVADTQGASASSPVRLPVVADLPAGSTREMTLVPGTAIRIMTGAPVPRGADAVVPVERTDRGVATVAVTAGPEQVGAYLRRAGEDIRRGQTVLEAGTRVGPRQIALLAAVGRARVRMRPRPRVVVVSSGDELVEPGRRLAHGQIYDANGYALTACVLEAGAVGMRVGIVRDDPRALMDALADQMVRADVVITSGGVSAGAYDTIKDVLQRLGTVRFDKVAMQPGMPQGVGTLLPGAFAAGRGGSGDGAGREETAVPIFTLPGNPVSAYVSFEVFVRPALRAMMGEASLHRPQVRAVATSAWRSSAGKRQFVRAELSTLPETGLGVAPVGGHGSHLVGDLARATCLAIVPEDVTEVSVGMELACMLLERGRR